MNPAVLFRATGVFCTDEKENIHKTLLRGYCDAT
jgi:hypothetical protein